MTHLPYMPNSPMARPAAATRQRSALLGRMLQCCSSQYRANRVMVLVACTVIFSIYDLLMTVEHVFAFGIIEVNPLARVIMSQGSVLSISLYKLACVSLFAYCLFKTRSKLSAEIAAWFCFAVLVVLSLYWVNYTHVVVSESEHFFKMIQFGEHDWLVRAE